VSRLATAERLRSPRPVDETAIKIERVVVVSDDVWPTGGAGGVARQNVLYAAQAGPKVTVLVGDSASSAGLPAEVEIAPVFGGALNEAAGLTAAIGGVFNAGVRNRVARWIAENDTPQTIYHLHNWHKSLSPSVFHALRRVERRLVMTAHDYFLVCPNGAFHNFRTGQPCDLAPLSGKCFAENCDKRRYLHKAWRVARHGVRAGLFQLASMNGLVLVPHEDVTPHLVRGGVRPERIKVLRNAVTPWTSHRVVAERQSGVLFVGRLEADKGVHLVAEAAQRCGLQLTVVGEGPLAAPLAAAYPGHRFLGRRTRAEIGEIAAQTRLLVVAPLWRETFGLVTFEGLLSGIPTMLSRSALVADELRRFDAAELFSGGDIEDLTAKLSYLNNDVGRLIELSVNGFNLRERVAPGQETWGCKLDGVYRKVLSDAQSYERCGP